MPASWDRSRRGEHRGRARGGTEPQRPSVGETRLTSTARPFGRTGALVARIGQGTFLMEHDDRQAAIRALQVGFDLGMTHVDTAELYGAGTVEEIVGEAARGRRDGLFLVSKVLPQNASREGTKLACERSLRRMKTDRIDCYLYHWPGAHPLEDTLGALSELRQEGKILSFGVSNFDERELAEAVRIAGPGNIACNQVLYHLGDRSMEHTILPFCEAHDIAVVGYVPFGRRAGFPPPGDAACLREVASRLGRTERQIALAFLTRRPSLFAVPKSSRAEHVRENAESAALDLSPADGALLDAAFPLGNRRAGVSRI